MPNETSSENTLILTPSQIHNPAIRKENAAEDGSFLLHLPHHDNVEPFNLERVQTNFLNEATRHNPQLFELITKPDGTTEKQGLIVRGGANLTQENLDEAKKRIASVEGRAEALYTATMGSQDLSYLVNHLIGIPLAAIGKILPLTAPPNESTFHELILSPNETIFNSTAEFCYAPNLSTKAAPRDIKAFRGKITLRAKLNIPAKRFELVDIKCTGTTLFNSYAAWLATQPISISERELGTHDLTSSPHHQVELLKLADSFLKFLKIHDDKFYRELVLEQARRLLEMKTVSSALSGCLAYDNEAVQILLSNLTDPKQSSEKKAKIIEIAKVFMETYSTQLSRAQKRLIVGEIVLQTAKGTGLNALQANQLAQLYSQLTPLDQLSLAYREVPPLSKMTAAIFITLFVAGTGVAIASFFFPFLPVISLVGVISLNATLLILCAALALLTSIGHLAHIFRTQDKLEEHLFTLQLNELKKPQAVILAVSDAPPIPKETQIQPPQDFCKSPRNTSPCNTGTEGDDPNGSPGHAIKRP